MTQDTDGEFTPQAKMMLILAFLALGFLLGLCGCSWGMNGQWLQDREVREVPREAGKNR